jgi:O-methyltransferase involved in polyketide biosynthesis
MEKDFTSISPTARALTQLKAFTKIPFAGETAQLIEASDRDFFGRIIHFENRYWTIEKLMESSAAKNVLELSSGYSFRGLDYCLRGNYHFIDTDLPEVINSKQAILSELLNEQRKTEMKGTLELLPLNVMNREEFFSITNRFSSGELMVVNEGLLIYLNEEEKKQLCACIHEVLKKRGGCWITGDIYLRHERDGGTAIDEQTKKFRRDHHIHENSFESFEAAEQFFNACGFKVTGKESLALEKLSILDRLKDRKEEVSERLQNGPAIRESWKLEINS